MAIDEGQHKAGTFWERYGRLVLSAILCVYSLPVAFFIAPNLELDGSWTRAVNMAVRNHLVFGARFIFTYGPLGFLSTRNIQYIANYLFLLGDLFLLAGVFYFLYKYVSRSKGWFFIVLMAMFFFRGVNYSQELFLVFILFAALGFKNSCSNYFESAYCAAAGVIVFFVKVNFGIISLVLLPLMAIFILVRNRKSFAVFVLSGLLFFSLIYFNVHIDLVNYVRNSLPLIQYYDESMYLAIVRGDMEFRTGMFFIAVFLLIAGFYTWQQIKQRKPGIDKIIPVFLLLCTCYLFYKNGFTRYDALHYVYFLSVFPLFIIAMVFLLGLDKYLLSKVVAILIIALSGLNLVLPRIKTGSFDFWAAAAYASPVQYFSGISEAYKDGTPKELMLPAAELTFIGKSTVDVFPIDIVVAQFNNLNYSPRPVPQSYQAYGQVLDSLNAGHFSSAGRPEFVLIKNNTVDKRYPIWDESITKAAIHLNYVDCPSFNADSVQDRSTQKLLLLRSKTGSAAYPEFERIGGQRVKMEDTVRISFSDSIPVYMTADIRYNLKGQLRKLFYQPPVISITLLMDNAESGDYELVRPNVKGPVLINKAVLSNADLRNFFIGNLKGNKNIRGFVLHANSSFFEPDIKIEFLRFSNY